MSRNLKIFS